MALPWREEVAPDWNKVALYNIMKEILKNNETLTMLMTAEERERGLTALMVGPSGHGKSSVVNGMHAALENQYHEVAIVRNQEYTATLEFRRHKARLPELTEDGNIVVTEDELNTDYFNVVFADFVGIGYCAAEEKGAQKTVFEAQIKTAMFGAIDQGLKVERRYCDSLNQLQIIEDKDVVEESTIPAMCIFWVVDILSCESDLGYMKEIIESARRQGIPQSLLLTKCDLIDEEFGKNPSRMYFSEVAEKQAMEKAAMVGMPFYRTFLIKNYVDEMTVSTELSYQYLHVLQFSMIDIEVRLRALIHNDKKRMDKLKRERAGLKGNYIG